MFGCGIVCLLDDLMCYGYKQQHCLQMLYVCGGTNGTKCVLYVTAGPDPAGSEFEVIDGAASRPFSNVMREQVISADPEAQVSARNGHQACRKASIHYARLKLVCSVLCMRRTRLCSLPSTQSSEMWHLQPFWEQEIHEQYAHTAFLVDQYPASVTTYRRQAGERS